MAIQQIQKSSAFKPEMVGDLVEITVYDQADGSLRTVAGALTAYSTHSKGVVAVIDGVERPQEIPSEGYTLSITHYEYILDLTTGDTE